MHDSRIQPITPQPYPWPKKSYISTLIENWHMISLYCLSFAYFCFVFSFISFPYFFFCSFCFHFSLIFFHFHFSIVLIAFFSFDVFHLISLFHVISIQSSHHENFYTLWYLSRNFLYYIIHVITLESYHIVTNSYADSISRPF